MKALKIVLWAGGVLCLLSVLGLALPFGSLSAMARRMTGEALPEAAAFAYAMRVIAATYVAIGVFFLIIARDPARYEALVTLAGAASAAIGVVCAVAGRMAGLRASWYVGDAATLIMFGVVVLAMQARVRRAPSA